jgi:hypothetical protein
MEEQDLISVAVFCEQHAVELSFVQHVEAYGLVPFTTVQEKKFVAAEDLATLERCCRLFYDLDINPPGIDAIQHLLQRMAALQEENRGLRNRLRLYEDD